MRIPCILVFDVSLQRVLPSLPTDTRDASTATDQFPCVFLSKGFLEIHEWCNFGLQLIRDMGPGFCTAEMPGTSQSRQQRLARSQPFATSLSVVGGGQAGTQCYTCTAPPSRPVHHVISRHRPALPLSYLSASGARGFSHVIK